MSLAAFGAGLSTLGGGLLDYSKTVRADALADRKLKLEQMRQDSLQEFEKMRLQESTRHNQAVETNAAERLTLDQERTSAAAEYQQGLTQAQREQIALQREQAGFRRDPESPEGWVFDQELADRNAANKRSASSGSMSATEADYQRELAIANELKAENDPRFADMTPAQMREYANNRARSSRVNPNAGSAAELRLLETNVKAIDEKIEAVSKTYALSAEERQEQLRVLQEQRNAVYQDAMEMARTLNAGGGLLTPPSSGAGRSTVSPMGMGQSPVVDSFLNLPDAR